MDQVGIAQVAEEHVAGRMPEGPVDGAPAKRRQDGHLARDAAAPEDGDLVLTDRDGIAPFALRQVSSASPRPAWGALSGASNVRSE